MNECVWLCVCTHAKWCKSSDGSVGSVGPDWNIYYMEGRRNPNDWMILVIAQFYI